MVMAVDDDTLIGWLGRLKLNGFISGRGPRSADTGPPPQGFVFLSITGPLAGESLVY